MKMFTCVLQLIDRDIVLQILLSTPVHVRIATVTL